MDKEEKYNIKKATLRQKEFCKKNGYPIFAPHNGYCYRCGNNIYNEEGISVEVAGNFLITGCPHCCYSFCD